MPSPLRYKPTLADMRDPERLLRVLERVLDHQYDLLERLETRKEHDKGSDPASSEASRLAAIEEAIESLSIGGPESALPTQRAAVPEVDALPPVTTATDGEIVLLSTDGLTYRFDAESFSWKEWQVSAPSNMMTTDTAQNVTATKTFDADQIFTEDVLLDGGADEAPKIAVTEADLAHDGVIQYAEGTFNIALNAQYDAPSWNRQDVTKAAVLIQLDTSNMIRIYRTAAGANPISWTTVTTWSSAGVITQAAAMTISDLVTLNRTGAQLLCQPSAATAADTVMIESKKSTADGAARTFAVDYEGDVLLNALIASSTGSFTGLLTLLAGMTLTNGPFNLPQTSISSTPYTMASTAIILNTSRSATGIGTVYLPASPGAGQLAVVNDTGGNCVTNPQTIDGNGANIDNATELTGIATNYFSVGFMYTGTIWKVLWYNG